MKDAEIEFSDQEMGFATIVSDMITSYRKVSVPLWESIGLTSGQPKILRYLVQHNGCNQKEISEQCNVEGATVTSLLVGHEKKGLVERRVLENNRREKRIYLTEKGWAKAEELPAAFRRLHQICSIGLSEDEVKLFMELCKRVGESLQEQRETDLELLCMA